MRKIIGCLFVLSLVGTFGACKKYTTPRRVEKIISVDSWTVKRFLSNGEVITSEFEGKSFGFGESKNIVVSEDENATGQWGTGLNKNPATLYITGFSYEPYTLLNDDWSVVSCSKKEFVLEADNGSLQSSVTFIKKELD